MPYILIFACSAFLYLGSILGSIISYLFLLSLVNIFFRSAFFSDVTLYVGFFVYLGYVLYDTQVTIEDFKRGNRDYFAHAILLYMDLFAMFTRLVTILMNKEEKKNARERD
ncbi:putative Bax inhibitor-1 [Cardiosporidium cionae]|uniref:Bax inhibitor-1 n=1 Tax=Cardiosporidium cionae TaxID=476202 RepID=A0ABQ7JG12_9APIC|nr:putative Bax inhibitor-1 [Cardiosporidium cionae]|eukprot:KAF8822903.1 putative Bax inhibitor-1 [Cardiosporidium cionae]